MEDTTVRSVLFAFIVAAWSPLLAGQTLLFPTPLHLTRSVDDPLMHRTAVIEEYCYGNRVVTVSGARTVIVDYDRQEITEIHRDERIYSVMTFDQAARAGASARSGTSVGAATKSDDWIVSPTGRRDTNTAAEYVEVQPRTRRSLKKLEIGVDRSVQLSKEAIEVLAGSAYPAGRSDQSQLVVRAAAPAAASATGQRLTARSTSAAPEVYGLPIEQSVTYDFEGADVVVRNRVTKVAHDTPPAAVLTIPPDAKRAEAHLIQTQRELEELDRLPSAPRPKP